MSDFSFIGLLWAGVSMSSHREPCCYWISFMFIPQMCFSLDLFIRRSVWEHWLCKTQLAPRSDTYERVWGIWGLLEYRLRLAEKGLDSPRTRYPGTETRDRLKQRGTEASICLWGFTACPEFQVTSCVWSRQTFPVTCRWGNPPKSNKRMLLHIDIKFG